MQVLSAAILHPHLQCFSLMPENNFTWPTFFSPAYVSANYMDDVWRGKNTINLPDQLCRVLHGRTQTSYPKKLRAKRDGVLFATVYPFQGEKGSITHM